VSPNEIARLAGPTRPLGALDIPQFHAPTEANAGVFAPRLYGAAQIHFADRRRKIDETRRVAFLLPLEPTSRTIDWDSSRPTELMPEALLREPPGPQSYLPLPAGAMDVKVFTRWAKAFDRWLARTQRFDVAPRDEGDAPGSLAPKRGGVSVELVAILWQLV
jgi:hypothetical protein